MAQYREIMNRAGQVAHTAGIGASMHPHWGTAAETLILSPQGRVEHHLTLTDDGTALWAHVAPGTGEALLAFLTPIVTLSFLFTTPEAWVAALGDAQHGFPYLSGAGRLVLKDVMMLAGALLVMADSARALLKAQPSSREDSDHHRGRLSSIKQPFA